MADNRSVRRVRKLSGTCLASRPGCNIIIGLNMAGGYPEVLRVPRIETPIKVGGKDVLFKGVEPHDFGRAFKEGGFRPLHPDRPWVTNHVETAMNYGGFSPINHPQARTRPVENGCVVAVRPEVTERRRLRAVTSGEGPLLSVGLKDYVGYETINWDDILKIVVTPAAYAEIIHSYNFVRPQDLSPEKLAGLMGIAQPATIRGFRSQVEQIVSSVLPRSNELFRPW